MLAICLSTGISGRPTLRNSSPPQYRLTSCKRETGKYIGNTHSTTLRPRRAALQGTCIVEQIWVGVVIFPDASSARWLRITSKRSISFIFLTRSCRLLRSTGTVISNVRIGISDSSANLNRLLTFYVARFRDWSVVVKS